MAIVDVETTGMSAHYHRIIEIAVLRVEGNKIVDTFSSLINPRVFIPPLITHITGIREEDLTDAPEFDDVKKKVKKILAGATFVAHNAWFDYSFIKTEMERVDLPFESKKCCTVRLSRRLYPQHRSHSLENIILRHNLKYKHRHRAYDDAFAVWQFLKKIKKEIPAKTISQTWEFLTQS